MRRTFTYIYILIGVIAISSCYHKKDQATILGLVSERDSLANVLYNRDSMVLAMNSYIGIIASSLDSIKTAEQIYTLTRDVEGKALSRDVIQDNLNLLESVIKRQRNRIAELDSVLKVTSDSVGYYRQIISYLYAQIDQKDEQINQMRQELNQKDRTITVLKERVNTIQQNLEQVETANQEMIDNNERIQNTGYILAASKKELQAMGVIERGLFKKKNVNYSNIETNRFDLVDKRTFTEISFEDDIKVLSSMPEDSYTITDIQGGVMLRITNPERFWSLTSYLIIQL